MIYILVMICFFSSMLEVIEFHIAWTIVAAEVNTYQRCMFLSKDFVFDIHPV